MTPFVDKKSKEKIIQEENKREVRVKWSFKTLKHYY